MKKILSLVLCLALVLWLPSCTKKALQVTEPLATEPQATEPQAPEPPADEPQKEVITDEVRAKLNTIMEDANYQGIAYLTHNGKVVYEYAAGTNDIGEPLTMDSPMYLCSISKQFCAAAILMLRDQGKLSLDDTLEKYFPEYTIGKDITLKNLLCIRSGIVRDFDISIIPEDCTLENAIVLYKDWLFTQKLNFEPNTNWEYSNNNYRLLSLVVEHVSGQPFEDYVHQNIFEPLGMTHSGFLSEIWNNPQWGLTEENLYDQGTRGLLSAIGAGSIVSTAEDMDIWMTALPSGKLISRESYEEMTSDHSQGQCPEAPYGYGYGLMGWLRSGWAHSGGNLGYSSWMYFNEEYGYNLFIISGKTPAYQLNYTYNVFVPLLNAVFVAESQAGN